MQKIIYYLLLHLYWRRFLPAQVFYFYTCKASTGIAQLALLPYG